MDKADADAVWHSIKDKVGLCIYPPTEDCERKLECLIPDKRSTFGYLGILEAIEDPEDLTTEDRTLITELFNSLEVAHSELASACSVLGRLSKNLKPRQLMVVLKASIRTLIQIKPPSALIEFRCSWWYVWASRWSRGKGRNTYDSRQKTLHQNH